MEGRYPEGSWRQRADASHRQDEHAQRGRDDWRARDHTYHQDPAESYNYNGDFNGQRSRNVDYWEGRWSRENEDQHHYYDHYYQSAYHNSSASGYSNQSYYTQPPRDAHYSQDYPGEGYSHGYYRRAYRPKVVLSEAYSESAFTSPQPRHYSTHSPQRLRHRIPETRSTYLRSKPRRIYHSRTLEPPDHYPMDVDPPRPLPLLVLDLNGTLVYRGKSSSTSERSKKPTLRPYLKSFLQYCLGIQRTDDSIKDHRDAWDEWESNLLQIRRNDSKGKDWPHGAHFWSKSTTEPEVHPGAKFRLLLWSSAQPHNVDSMAKAILSPQQAEHLLRVYARDTLVTRRLYSQKAPSVKDLEILWAVLNNASLGKEGEKRLLAEAREGEDQESPDEDDEGKETPNRGASNESANFAHRNIVLPEINGRGYYKDGAGYGQHNTLLLDDSIDKAKLQPFNHILLPEFIQSRAQKVVAAMSKASEVKEDEDYFRRGSDIDGEVGSETIKHKHHKKEKEKKADDVLLQVVGVLEHARYQANVSSWIRFGGLGDFGGMQKEHPYYLDEDVEGLQVDDSLIERAASYFAKDAKSDDPLQGPRLNATVTQRTESFWAEEGTATLKRHNIPIQRF